MPTQFTSKVQYDPAEGVCAGDERQTRPRLAALAVELMGHLLEHAHAHQEWPQQFTFLWGSCAGGAVPRWWTHRCTFPGDVPSLAADRRQDVRCYAPGLVGAAAACLTYCDPGAVLLSAQMTASSMQPMPAKQRREEDQAAAAQLEEQHLSGPPAERVADERAPLQASALLAAIAAAASAGDTRMGRAVVGAIARRRQVIASLQPGGGPPGGSPRGPDA